MKRSTVVALGGAFVVVALLVAGVTQVSAADSNARLGTWKQNVAKSKYDPGPAPKSSTRTYAPFEGDGVKYTSETVNADGSRDTFSYTAHYDGKDYPYMDSTNNSDTIALKRIDEYTIDTTQKKGGKVTQTSRSVISKDGKTITQTQKGTNARGPFTNLRVFDKQ